MKNIFGIRRWLGKLLERFALKRTVLNLTVYNPVLVFIQNKINLLRWPHADLSIIFWPPVQDMFDELQDDLSHHCEILDYEDLTIPSNRFKDFVDMVYAVDPSRAAKAEFKHKHLMMPELHLRILEVRVAKPAMTTGDLFNSVRSATIKSIKGVLRKKYRERVPNYVYDIIIHSTDNEDQSQKLAAQLHILKAQIEKDALA